jgi:hypothetical protein
MLRALAVHHGKIGETLLQCAALLEKDETDHDRA